MLAVKFQSISLRNIDKNNVAIVIGIDITRVLKNPTNLSIIGIFIDIRKMDRKIDIIVNNVHIADWNYGVI